MIDEVDDEYVMWLELRAKVFKDALKQIVANTEKSAIKHMGHDGMTAYEALAKAVHDCAKVALDEVRDD